MFTIPISVLGEANVDRDMIPEGSEQWMKVQPPVGVLLRNDSLSENAINFKAEW